MTVKFCFGNTRKDGTKNLKIRLKSNGRDKKIGIDGIYIEQKYWDKSNNRVKSTHPNAGAYNEIITNYQNKIIKVKGQLELKQIDFDTAFKMLSSSSKTNSITEFVKIHCNHKSKQWKRNTIGVLNSVKSHLNIDDMNFDDMTFENLQKLKAILKEKNISKETYNNYLRHLRAAYNYALTSKITYREFNFPKELFYKINKHNKKLLTHTPADISKAIDNISIKTKHRSAVSTAIRDFQAIGFWLLKFSMRGLYGKDITSLTAFNSDYNYSYRTNYLSQEAKQQPMTINGNPNFLDHKRHKTENIMRIWITLPPIGGLITVLQRLVALTHPHISYLSKEDLNKSGDELFKTIKNYDSMRIFKHSTENISVDDALWNNYNKHLRKLGLYSFQSARKSFNTTATYLRISDDIRRTLIGQTDQSVQRSYNNYNDIRLVKAIQESHLQILYEFRMIELFDKWIFKLNDTLDLFHDYHVGAGSQKVYKHQYEFLLGMLNVTKTLIDDKKGWKEIVSNK